MKFLSLVSPLVLGMSTMSSFVAATPVAGFSIEGLGNTNLEARQQSNKLPKVQIQDILNLATAVFGIQLVGAQSHRSQIDNLCNHFDPTNLGAAGYNVTLLHDIFCEALSVYIPVSSLGGNATPNPAEIKAQTVKFSTYIWIFQAFGVVNNDPYLLGPLCSLLSPRDAAMTGLDFNLVKKSICDGGKGIPLPKVVDLPLPFSELPKSNGTVVRPSPLPAAATDA
ncbi:MAG: hypothetical protein Q9168_003228 [Polycauliona sp. 1 TL-2023]